MNLAQPRTNWSGNHIYRAAGVAAPRTMAELQELVASSPRLRALGSRHSFNSVADVEDGLQVSLEHFSEIVLDRASQTVRVGSGVRYAELARHLHAEGCALHNMASLPHISVAGATATATHGSGLQNGNLATAVEAVELVLASGERRRFSRESDSGRWEGMVVALGSLGIVSSLTLRVEPTYAVRQDVYEHLPLATLARELKAVFGSGYSVSAFTDWQSGEAEQLWVKRRTTESDRSPAAAELFGARAATRERHPLPEHNAGNCTPQLGIPGPWHERLPHFRSDFTPSSGAELQSEYFVPIERGAEAIEAVARLGERIRPLLLVAEMRTIAEDGLWLSPCYRRTSLALHFTWKLRWPEVRALLPEIEEALAPLGARPHWAKLFTMEPERVRTLYPMLGAFGELARELDGQGKFRNAFVERYVL